MTYVGAWKRKNVEENVGIPVQFCECERRRGVEKESGVERTPVERQTMRMYARREETWRPLNRRRVAAFIRLFLLWLVEVENDRGSAHPATAKRLKKVMVRRVIPWIHNRLVYTMNEQQWSITLQQFRELDQYLADHLPRTHRDDPWETVAYFFKEVVRQREEYMTLEEMER